MQLRDAGNKNGAVRKMKEFEAAKKELDNFLAKNPELMI